MLTLVPLLFSIILLPDYTPSVVSYVCLNSPVINLDINVDFPTPESPIRDSFICFIYFCVVTFSFFGFSSIRTVIKIYVILY